MWAIARGRGNVAIIRKKQRHKFMRELALCFATHDHYCISINQNITWCEQHICAHSKKQLSSTHFITDFTQLLESHGHKCITCTSNSIKWCGQHYCTGFIKEETIDKGCYDTLLDCF